MQILKYPLTPSENNDSEVDHRVQQLIILAQALADEIETLQAELSNDRTSSEDKQIAFDKDGIDFYHEIERYEIELIRGALKQCGGNQSNAAKLLHMKSTTLNAKVKHYGLNPVRSISEHRRHDANQPRV